jgi:hypothetical protein
MSLYSYYCISNANSPLKFQPGFGSLSIVLLFKIYLLPFEILNSTYGSLSPIMSALSKDLAKGANTLKLPGYLGTAAKSSFSFLILSYSCYYYLAISSYRLLGYC